MGRDFEKADFEKWTVSVQRPPARDKTSAVLILLHGLGDSESPLAKLAEQMALPETLCVAVRGPHAMPFDLGGFHWGDDLVFDQRTGDLDTDTAVDKAVVKLRKEVVEDVLQQKCGFSLREIMLMGIGQGGTVALELALSMGELGGVISLGGPLPGARSGNTGKTRTPVLVMGGERATSITNPRLGTIKSTFSHTEYHKYPRSGDGVPRNRAEMLPVMRFFARRLPSQKGVPEGAIAL